MRGLIGGVGYPDLADHSVSWRVIEALERAALPVGVVAEDISYNPVAVAQRLDDEPDDDRFGVVVVVAGVARGRLPGTLTAYRWDGRLPEPDQVHRAVTDAVQGIIHVDNTLVVVAHLGALPPEVVVVEVEPLVEAFAAPLSAPVDGAFAATCALAVACASDAAARRRLPRCGLGGPVAEDVA